MPDNSIIPGSNTPQSTLGITADQVATLSPEAKDALDKQLATAGFSAEQRNSIGLSGHPSSAAPAAKMTLEEANRQLQITAPRSLEVGNSPNDYRFQFERRFVEGKDPVAIANVQKTYAEAFHEAGIPLSVSQAIVHASMESAERYAKLSPQERETDFNAERARLQRLASGKMIREYADFAWKKLPHSFRDNADKHGMFRTAAAVNALAQAGELMLYRINNSKK